MSDYREDVLRVLSHSADASLPNRQHAFRLADELTSEVTRRQYDTACISIKWLQRYYNYPVILHIVDIAAIMLEAESFRIEEINWHNVYSIRVGGNND